VGRLRITPPSFKVTSMVPRPDTRQRRAGAWAALFGIGLWIVFMQGPDLGPARFSYGWVLGAWMLSHVVCAWIAVVSTPRIAGSAPKLWRQVLRAGVLPAIYLVLVGTQFFPVTGMERGVPSPPAVEAFLAEQVSPAAISDWDEDVQVWSLLLQAGPDDAARERAVRDFRAAIVPLLDDGDFVIHGTLAAAADVGVYRDEGARALLMAPRLHSGLDPQSAEAAAHAWLGEGRARDLTDPREYAFAHAVHDVLPRSGELHALVSQALAAEGQPLPGHDSLAGLNRLVRLADLVGADTEVPAFRGRVLEALRFLHRDEFDISWAWSIGFASDPAGPGNVLVDPLATHAAFELMDRFGVPDFVDLARQREACDYRSQTHWYTFPEKLVSAHDVAYLARRWPEQSAPVFTWVDAQLPLALVLLWVALDRIRRKPLVDPRFTATPAERGEQTEQGPPSTDVPQPAS
jgi:hypothetical protein